MTLAASEPQDKGGPEKVANEAVVGTVKGTVNLEGTPPPNKELNVGTCTSEVKGPVYSDAVLAKDGKLQNAFVWIKSGIDPAKALEVLQAGPAFSRVMETKGPKMLRGDFAPEARLAQHYKDVKLILAAAQKAGAKAPLSQVHELLLSALVAAGCGDLDNSAIVRAFAPSGLNASQGGA